MRAVWKAIARLLPLLVLASPALAGITVTSYETIARVNGYAPTSQTQFFEHQTLTDVSPAFAQVSGDWMGPNAGGTTPTWHYVGSAQTATTTVFDAESLIITAAGSFGYTLDTTPDFVDPSSVTIFGPGATANYNGFFNTEVPTVFAVTGQLNQWSQVRLNTLAGSVVFNHINVSTNPVLIDLAGTIAPGHYRLLVASGVAAPNFPNGVNHYERSGGFDNVIFSVLVPEPSTLGVVIAIGGSMLRRRKRSACAL